MPSRTVHLIPHTHWDREWYLPVGAFQARLGEMVDGLLALLATDGRLSTFLLDGQTVLLEDYLAVRPDQRNALVTALRAGRLQSGPWYVLADEQIPAGESLLRNLALGREDLRRLDPASSGTCYSPDAFGHPAALPAIAREFGLETAVVWRGLHPDLAGGKDLCWWEAPDGRRVLVYHLPADGYEIGSALAGLGGTGEEADRRLAAAWAAIAAKVAPRAATSQVAVFVGADHHAADPGLGTLAARLSRLVRGYQFRISSLSEFFAAARRDLPDLPVLSGELRDSYGYTWTLQGVHGTRAPLKRRNSRLELLLLRHAEPLAALSGRAGAAASLQQAWRQLVQCHFHDAIAGTASDAVARAMTARFDDVEAIAAEAIRVSGHALAGHDADAAREGSAVRPRLHLWNPAARPRGGVVLAEVTAFRGDVLVGPPGGRKARRGPGFHPFTLASGELSVVPQVLDVVPGEERADAARHYPDQDVVDRVRIAVPLPQALPGLGLAGFDLAAGRGKPLEEFALARGRALGNGRIHAAVDPSGRIQLSHPAGGVRFDDLAGLESEQDQGDCYTFSAVPRAAITRPSGRVHPRVLWPGPLAAAIEWPLALGKGAAAATASLTLEVIGDQPVLRGRLQLENRAEDRRLRLRFPTGLRRTTILAGTHFGAVSRFSGAQGPVRKGGLRERPVSTAPAHRWVAAASKGRGLAFFMPGFFEYEWTRGGDLLVTLLRSVGELSRSGLRERPGHAGWPTPTPQAQCPGPEVIEFGLGLVTEDDLRTVAELERRWEDAFLPPLALWIRECTATELPGAAGMELAGDGLVFSSCHAAWGQEGVMLRCYNAGARDARGTWRFARPLREARRVRADGGDGVPLSLDQGGRAVSFPAGPHEIISLLVTFR
jgi:alpha-mannosidase